MLAALAPALVDAHAVVVSSTPASDAHVAAGDISVQIRFSSRIDPARSRVTLVAPDGAQATVPVDGSTQGVLAGRGRVDRTGHWKLHWQVLSVDGHVTRGDVPFEVRAGAPTK